MRNGLICAAVLFLVGCTLGPDYKRPDIDLPKSAFDSTLLDAQQEKALAFWWTRFRDPVLNQLIDQALDSNLDIALQAQRVREARAQLGLANAQLYPSISGQAQGLRERSSQALSGVSSGGSTGGSAGGTGGGTGGTGGSTSGSSRLSGSGSRYNYYSVAATLSYELDIFGGLRRASEQARAQLLSSAYTQDAMKLTVVSDVVTNYMSVRSLQRQIQVTRQTIKARRQALSLDQMRFKYGAIDKLTLLQTRSLLETAKAQLSPLLQQESQTRTALAILVGKTPRQVMQDTQVADGSFDDITLPTDLPLVLPSLLINRRPDVRASEASLIAANANVGVAKAQFFPTFNLSAMIGTQALSVNQLFNQYSEIQQIGGDITAPIFDFGRRNAQYRTALAQKQEALIQYRQTIRQAFQDVHDALDEIQYSRQLLDERRQQVDSYKEYYKLAQLRYQAGLTNYFDVLDAQRQLFTAQLSLATAIRDRFTATADLYKALGGGWTQDTDALPPDLEADAAHYTPAKKPVVDAKTSDAEGVTQ